jgi:hypothetical protein
MTEISAVPAYNPGLAEKISSVPANAPEPLSPPIHALSPDRCQKDIFCEV